MLICIYPLFQIVHGTAPQCPGCREANNWFAPMGVRLPLFPLTVTHYSERSIKNGIIFSQIFLLWIFDTVVFSFQPYIIANWFYTSLPIKKQLREENSISPVMLLCADAWNARQCQGRRNSQLKTFWSEAPPILSRRSIFSEMKWQRSLNCFWTCNANVCLWFKN